MADAMGELWRVGWRPSTPSITQWWTWEAGLWQLRGVALVDATDGAKYRAWTGILVVVAGGLRHRRGLVLKAGLHRMQMCFCIIVLFSFFQLKQPGPKTISWKGSPLLRLPLRGSVVLQHPVWTMNQDATTDSIERSNPARKGCDAPTQRQSGVLNGLSDIWPRHPNGCQHHTLTSFCAWRRDRMFFSVWPTCSCV